MNWFERHLNWTWLVGFIVVSLIVVTFIPYFRIWVISSQSYAGVFIVLPLSAWVLHRKNRSVWFLLLSTVIVLTPILLTNHRYQEAYQ
jgi:hypothetical protein